MADRTDGGPAFPQLHGLRDRGVDGRYYEAQSAGGMSLRDYFAGQALTGWLAMHADHEAGVPNAVDTAKAAYRYADALLAAAEGK